MLGQKVGIQFIINQFKKKTFGMPYNHPHNQYQS